MAVCWQYTDGRTEQLSDDEVIELFWCLKDEIKELKEQNAKLTAETEQLKTANGKAVKALRRSSTALRKNAIQRALEEDQHVDHTAMCRACQEQCTDAKALLGQLDLYEDQGDSPVLQGIRMELARMSGACEDKKRFNEQFKNTVERYGNARGVCPQ
jgi:hypothetical protein